MFFLSGFSGFALLLLLHCFLKKDQIRILNKSRSVLSTERGLFFGAYKCILKSR